MNAPDPMKCGKRRSNGQPCAKHPIKGGTVCRLHGGSAPQVKAAAQARLLALVDPALGVLARATRARKDKNWEPTAQEIAAAKDILDRAGVGKEKSVPVDLDSKTPGFTGTLEELLITLRRVTIEVPEK